MPGGRTGNIWWSELMTIRVHFPDRAPERWQGDLQRGPQGRTEWAAGPAMSPQRCPEPRHQEAAVFLCDIRRENLKSFGTGQAPSSVRARTSLPRPEWAHDERQRILNRLNLSWCQQWNRSSKQKVSLDIGESSYILLTSHSNRKRKPMLRDMQVTWLI